MNQMVEEYLRLPYTRRVRPDEGTRGEPLFFAWVEELPGCESHGETADEALEWLEDAIAMYIGDAGGWARAADPGWKHAPGTW